MKKNKLEVVKMHSKYCLNEHYGIKVDGVSLDALLHAQYSEINCEGLVPTMPDWLEDSRERTLVLSRYLSRDPIVMLPLFMCPDDCDLWCTLIIAEVIQEGSCIRWSRMGLDQSTGEELIRSYKYIGASVNWLDKIPSMVFDREEYDEQINKLLHSQASEGN